jgi:hypothetical protein
VKDTDAKGSERELIRDPHSRRGFLLLDAKPGQRVVYGKLAGGEPGVKPVWDLAQWSSKFPLAVAPPQRQINGMLGFTNAAKLVVIGAPGRTEADLVFGVNASFEYDNRARQEGDWLTAIRHRSRARPSRFKKLPATSANLTR